MTDNDDSSYPSAWTPKGLPFTPADTPAIELFLASLSDTEFTALCNRVRDW